MQLKAIRTLGRSAAAVALAGVAASIVVTAGGASPKQGTAQAAERVVVGPGIAEDTVRQLVRTPGQIVFAFAPDDTAQRRNAGPGVIHAYRAQQPRRPVSFGEVDGVHRPTAAGAKVLYAPDVRLDRHGIAHLVYGDEDGRLFYQTFSTIRSAWGPRRQVGAGATPNPGFYATPARVYRNWASYGLVLDRRDRPHVVYCSGDSVLSRSLIGGRWTQPHVVARGHSPIHVQLAVAAADRIDATWLDDPLGSSASVMFAQASAAGRWGAPQVVDRGSPAVIGNGTDDQGPSIVVTAAGIPYVLYLSGTTNGGQAVTTATVRSLRGGRWRNDGPPHAVYGITHSPQLYSRDNDVYVFLGHDAAIHFGYLVLRGGRTWSRYVVLDAASAADGSASVRWDPRRDPNPHVIDALHHAEDATGTRDYLPQLLYSAVTP